MSDALRAAGSRPRIIRGMKTLACRTRSIRRLVLSTARTTVRSTALLCCLGLPVRWPCVGLCCWRKSRPTDRVVQGKVVDKSDAASRAPPSI